MNVVEASMLLRFSTLAGAFALCGCGSLLGLDDFTDAGEGGASASAGGGSTTTVTSTSDATQVASSSSSATQGAGGGGGENVGPGAGGGVTSSVTTSVTTSTSTSTTVGAGGAGPECPVDTVCVPDAPNGWTGPAAIYVGDAPPAECPAPWTETITANAGNVQGAHTCSPCTCGDATGAQCSAPQIRVYGTGTCTGTPGTYTLPTNGTCVDTGGGYGARGTASLVTDAGACPESGGLIAADTPSWDDAAVLCGFDGGLTACGSAGVCAPAPAAPLAAKLCVYRDGEEPGCPLGYPVRNVLHRGANDTRDCSSCACALPTGVSCPDVIDAFAGTNCSSQTTTVPGTTCDNSTYYQSARFVNRPVGGTCTPSGGNPTGQLSPTLPLTVCCLE